MIIILKKTIYKLIQNKSNYEDYYNKKICYILDLSKFNQEEISFFKNLIYKICIETADSKLPSYTIASHALYGIISFYDNNLEKNLINQIDTAEFINFYNSVLYHFNDFIFYLKVSKKLLK